MGKDGSNGLDLVQGAESDGRGLNTVGGTTVETWQAGAPSLPKNRRNLSRSNSASRNRPSSAVNLRPSSAISLAKTSTVVGRGIRPQSAASKQRPRSSKGDRPDPMTGFLKGLQV